MGRVERVREPKISRPFSFKSPLAVPLPRNLHSLYFSPLLCLQSSELSLLPRLGFPMEKYGSGFVGDGRLCMPGAAATRRIPQTSGMVCVEDLTRKLAGLGLPEENHLALSTTKKHCIPPHPLFRRPPLPPTLDLSPPFQRFRRREEWDMEEGFEFSCERCLVGRNAGLAERRPAGADAYERGRLSQIHSQIMTRDLQVRSGRHPTSIPRRQVSCHAPVIPSKSLGSRRRCGGTGVFLPRVVDQDDMFGPGLRSRGGLGTAGGLVLQREEYMELGAVAVDEQKPTSRRDTPRPPPPVEQLLPQDWSY